MIIEWKGKQIDTDKPMESCDSSEPAYFVGVRQCGKYVIEYEVKGGMTYSTFDADDVLYNFRNIPEKKVVERWVVVSDDDHVSVWHSENVAKKTAASVALCGVRVRIHHIREEF